MANENHMSHGPAVSPQSGVTGEQSTRQQTKSGSTPRTQSDETGRTQQTSAKLRTSQATTGSEVLDQAKERFQTFKRDTDQYVRNNPTKAVFTALGIGFVLGLMRRR